MNKIHIGTWYIPVNENNSITSYFLLYIFDTNYYLGTYQYYVRGKMIKY